MGICSSCEAATAAITPLATAKLVLEDGELREFSRPITVSNALQQILHEGKSSKKDTPNTFICSADDLEFGGVVESLSPEEELQLGQLYFILPRSMLGRPMQPDDMAKLAVKASTAFMAKCRFTSSPSPLVFTETEERSRPRAATVAAAAAERGQRAMSSAERRRRARSAGGSGRSFASDLTIILE